MLLPCAGPCVQLFSLNSMHRCCCVSVVAPLFVVFVSSGQWWASSEVSDEQCRQSTARQWSSVGFADWPHWQTCWVQCRRVQSLWSAVAWGNDDRLWKSGLRHKKCNYLPRYCIHVVHFFSSKRRLSFFSFSFFLLFVTRLFSSHSKSVWQWIIIRRHCLPVVDQLKACIQLRWLTLGTSSIVHDTLSQSLAPSVKYWFKHVHCLLANYHCRQVRCPVE